MDCAPIQSMDLVPAGALHKWILKPSTTRDHSVTDALVLSNPNDDNDPPRLTLGRIEANDDESFNPNLAVRRCCCCNAGGDGLCALRCI